MSIDGKEQGRLRLYPRWGRQTAGLETLTPARSTPMAQPKSIAWNSALGRDSARPVDHYRQRTRLEISTRRTNFITRAIAPNLLLKTHPAFPLPLLPPPLKLQQSPPAITCRTTYKVSTACAAKVALTAYPVPPLFAALFQQANAEPAFAKIAAVC